MVLRLAEPVDAIVLDTDLERSLQPLDVGITTGGTYVRSPEERRVPDDAVGSRPEHLESVGGLDAGQIDQR
jgi:hypothetical protein